MYRSSFFLIFSLYCTFKSHAAWIRYFPFKYSSCQGGKASQNIKEITGIYVKMFNCQEFDERISTALMFVH